MAVGAIHLKRDSLSIVHFRFKFTDNQQQRMKSASMKVHHK